MSGWLALLLGIFVVGWLRVRGGAGSRKVAERPEATGQAVIVAAAGENRGRGANYRYRGSRGGM